MSIFSFIKSHAVLASTVVVVGAAAAVIGGRVSSRNAAPTVSNSNVKHVSLVSVSDFRADTGSVAVDGVIQSVEQVDLKSQISAPISYVAVALGDTVVQGQVLAELSNADIRAQLEQAKLSLSAEGVSLGSARETAIDAVRDSYLKADEVVHTEIDPMLYNSTKTSVQLSAYTTQANYQEILAVRTDITNAFTSWQNIIGKLDQADDKTLVDAIRRSKDTVEKIRIIVDDISRALNEAAILVLPSDMPTLNTWKGTITAARTSISATAAALTAADKAFSNSLVTQGGTGTSPSTVALAGVKNLEAQLDKTIIRSPITGRVAALPLRTGEYASPGTLVATVVGTGGIQVDAFASAEDIAGITKGAKAIVAGTTTGTVMSVSPSVNPTNRKVEVKILIDNPAESRLVIGENVKATIKAARTSSTAAQNLYHLPIQNVKIVPGEAYVFTVDADSKLVKHNITLGTVQGDDVEVQAGLEDSMQIVTPVYELEAGQEVVIN